MARPLVPTLCPRYHRAVELLGRRWTGAIVRLLLAGPARFHELRAGVPALSDRMLAERLRELEREDIVIRTVLPETPVRVEYALTAKGHALDEAIDAIGKWAERWIPAEPARPRAKSAAAKRTRPERRPADARGRRGARRRSPAGGRRNQGA